MLRDNESSNNKVRYYKYTKLLSNEGVFCDEDKGESTLEFQRRKTEQIDSCNFHGFKDYDILIDRPIHHGESLASISLKYRISGKVQDEIKKVGKSIHPKSRKAKQLSRQVNRDAKMAKKKAFTNMKLQLLGEKIHWFKKNMDDSLKVYSHQQMLEFIKRYIERHNEEMELITFKQNVGNRKSRQHASREDLIRINKENELAEFNGSGLETVDLTDSENMKNFILWNGELRYVNNLKLFRFRSNVCEGSSSSIDTSTL